MVQVPIPADPLARFREIYQALNARRGWLESATPLQFSALSLITTPGEPDDIAAGLYALAEDLQKRTGWFGDLRSPTRFLIAANLLRAGESAEMFCAAVADASEIFREQDLRRGSAYEAIAILMLRQQDPHGRVHARQVTRFRAIYRMMKSYHWWLTGPDDYPACALLGAREERPHEIGRRVEAFYLKLKEMGLSAGDDLQTVSHILYFNPTADDEVLVRFQSLHDGFRAAGISMQRSDYDEIAILTFLDHDAAAVVGRVMEHREVMAALKPNPGRSLTFSLACGTAFLELAKLTPALESVAEARLLKQLEDIVQAQSAAAMQATTTVLVATS
jgi:hypothetical protein